MWKRRRDKQTLNRSDAGRPESALSRYLAIASIEDRPIEPPGIALYAAHRRRRFARYLTFFKAFIRLSTYF